MEREPVHPFLEQPLVEHASCAPERKVCRKVLSGKRPGQAGSNAHQRQVGLNEALLQKAVLAHAGFMQGSGLLLQATCDLAAEAVIRMANRRSSVLSYTPCIFR